MLFCATEGHCILASLSISSYQHLPQYHSHTVLKLLFIIITGEPKTLIIFAALSVAVTIFSNYSAVGNPGVRSTKTRASQIKTLQGSINNVMSIVIPKELPFLLTKRPICTSLFPKVFS